ncbi:unnamed protein product [Polarella glacialis]|uniref:N-acetyltransferase domain-containing protein n=1 Tax=Polarella glacialis TaxID=89957 RepID=A0A813K7B4_POLGL|nr:unnamed protein product [Polarella glacialis]
MEAFSFLVFMLACLACCLENLALCFTSSRLAGSLAMTGAADFVARQRAHPRLTSVFRGTLAPTPPDGTLLGRWRLETDFAVKRFANVLSLCLAGHPKNAGDAKLLSEVPEEGGEAPAPSADVSAGGPEEGAEPDRPPVDASTAIPNIQPTFKDGVTGSSLVAHMAHLDEPMDVRIELTEPDKILVQTRAISEEQFEQESKVEQWKKAWCHVLAMIASPHRGAVNGEMESTYGSKWPMRLDLVSQVFCLRAKEQAALEKAPRARTDVQLAKASEFLARAEAARERDQAELRLILAAENEKGFGLSGTAVRIPTLTTACLDWLLSSTSSSEDKSGKRLHPVSVAYESTENCARLRQAGWYLPPEAQDTEPYPGLVVERAVNLAPHFCFEPRKEDLPSKQVHLASYVGEGDGYLSPALEQAARYLDDGFDGLCIHAVPTLQAPEFNKRLKDFALAVVLGPSGSGKTALACERFGGPLVVQWSDEVSALAHFVSFEEARSALAAVCLDIQTAMRPAGFLSGGERERASLARGLAEWAAGRQKTLAVDEFTSLLDRPLAKRVARGVTAFVRSRPTLRGLVLLTCHTDIVGERWLAPDWLFECGNSRLMLLAQVDCAADTELCPPAEHLPLSGCASFGLAEAEGQAQPRALGGGDASSLTLVVRRALPCEWRKFREHHYKDHRLNHSSVCFVGELEGRAVVFTAILNTGFNFKWFLGRNSDEKVDAELEKLGLPVAWKGRMLMREHRTVVMPDSQGLGLGSLMADAVAHICCETGHAFMSTTAHPTYGGYRDRSPLWSALASSRRERGNGQYSTFSHVWRGAASHDEAPCDGSGGSGGIDQERAELLAQRGVARRQGEVQAVLMPSSHFAASWFSLGSPTYDRPLQYRRVQEWQSNKHATRAVGALKPQVAPVAAAPAAERIPIAARHSERITGSQMISQALFFHERHSQKQQHFPHNNGTVGSVPAAASSVPAPAAAPASAQGKSFIAESINCLPSKVREGVAFDGSFSGRGAASPEDDLMRRLECLPLRCARVMSLATLTCQLWHYSEPWSRGMPALLPASCTFAGFTTSGMNATPLHVRFRSLIPALRTVYVRMYVRNIFGSSIWFNRFFGAALPSPPQRHDCVAHYAPSAATPCPGGETPTTVTALIQAAADDAEESDEAATAGTHAVGQLYETSSDIELGYDNDKYIGNQYVGLRFAQVNVPANSYVHTAHIAFIVDAIGDCCNETFDITVKMQKSTDASVFTGQSNAYLRSLWTGVSTTASMTYSPVLDDTVGALVTTPDISHIVQEVVGQADWQANKAMVVLFGGSTGSTEQHSREYESYNTSPDQAPKLVITYCPILVVCLDDSYLTIATVKVGSSTDDAEEAVPGSTAGTVARSASSSDLWLGYGSQIVGLRFPVVHVPQGANVLGAVVKFWVDDAGACCNADLNVTAKMALATNQPSFASQASGYLNTLYTTGSTSAEVTYTPPIDTDVHQPRYSADLTVLAQEVVDQSGWVHGKAMAVLFGNNTFTEDASREYVSFDTDPNLAPGLVVLYCSSAAAATTTAAAGSAAAGPAGFGFSSGASGAAAGVLTGFLLLAFHF